MNGGPDRFPASLSSALAPKGNNLLDTCEWRGVISLAMFPFYAVTFSLAVSQLQSAAHSLALASTGQYPSPKAWNEAATAVEVVADVCKGTPLQKWLNDSEKLQRLYA